MDKAYTFIKCCLEGKKQRVIFMDKFLKNNTCYNWGTVKHSVPQ